MEVLKEIKKTEQNYRQTQVQLCIMLVIYMENDKDNGLNIQILE